MNMNTPSARPACFVFLILMALCSAHAAPTDYPAVISGRPVIFPRDHGGHPQFRTEWWYVTGWLEDESGVARGFQVTFFRSRPGIDEANPSQFAAKQLLFAHAAVSDPGTGRLLRAEKAARAGFGLAQADAGDMNVWIDDWKLRRAPDSGTLHTTIATEDFTLQLELRMTQPPLLQGVRGFSQKGPNPKHASYYYSLPQLSVAGNLAMKNGSRRVRGSAWLDHEWSSEILDENASGWDWVGLNLDDGGVLMAFRMRDRAGQSYWAGGTLRTARAQVTTYGSTDIAWAALRHWRSPHTQIEYPIEWHIDIGARRLTLKPLMDDQENDARGSTGTLYWEGAVRAFEHGRPIGRGYLELTGYGGRIRF